MDKLLNSLSPGRAVGLGAVLMTILGWISRMEFETEAGRIAQMIVLAVLAGGVLVVIYLAQHAPSPRERSARKVREILRDR